MAFAVMTGVRSMNEVFPLEQRPRGLRPDDGRRRALPRGPEESPVTASMRLVPLSASS